MHVRHVKSKVDRLTNYQGPEVIIRMSGIVTCVGREVGSVVGSDVGKVVGSEVGKAVGNLESIESTNTKKTVKIIVRLRSVGVSQ